MAVTDAIVSAAGDLELYKQWKTWMPLLTKIGYRYVKGEARCYYRHKDGRYYYRTVAEAEMHRMT